MFITFIQQLFNIDDTDARELINTVGVSKMQVEFTKNPKLQMENQCLITVHNQSQQYNEHVHQKTNKYLELNLIILSYHTKILTF